MVLPSYNISKLHQGEVAAAYRALEGSSSVNDGSLVAMGFNRAGDWGVEKPLLPFAAEAGHWARRGKLGLIDIYRPNEATMSVQEKEILEQLSRTFMC
jgi:hypothetical protein